MKNQENILYNEDINLSEFDIFKDLSSNELQKLTPKLKCHSFQRSALIFQARNRINCIYLVVSGILKTFITGFDGKEQITRFEKRGDLIGYSSIFDDEITDTTTKTITPTILCHIPGEQLTLLFNTNPLFAMNLMKIACKELKSSNKYLADLAQKTVRERLAEVLLLLMNTFDLEDDGTLKILLTREEIANLVGTATESVIRLLSEFKSNNLIELHGRKVKLKDINQLIKIGNIYD